MPQIPTASKRPHQARMAEACLPPTSFSPISPALHLCLRSATTSRPSRWQPVPCRGLRCCAPNDTGSAEFVCVDVQQFSHELLFPCLLKRSPALEVTRGRLDASPPT